MTTKATNHLPRAAPPRVWSQGVNLRMRTVTTAATNLPRAVPPRDGNAPLDWVPGNSSSRHHRLCAVVGNLPETTKATNHLPRAGPPRVRSQGMNLRVRTVTTPATNHLPRSGPPPSPEPQRELEDPWADTDEHDGAGEYGGDLSDAGFLLCIGDSNSWADFDLIQAFANGGDPRNQGWEIVEWLTTRGNPYELRRGLRRLPRNGRYEDIVERYSARDLLAGIVSRRHPRQVLHTLGYPVAATEYYTWAYIINVHSHTLSVFGPPKVSQTDTPNIFSEAPIESMERYPRFIREYSFLELRQLGTNVDFERSILLALAEQGVREYGIPDPAAFEDLFDMFSFENGVPYHEMPSPSVSNSSTAPSEYEEVYMVGNVIVGRPGDLEQYLGPGAGGLHNGGGNGGNAAGAVEDDNDSEDRSNEDDSSGDDSSEGDSNEGDSSEGDSSEGDSNEGDSSDDGHNGVAMNNAGHGATPDSAAVPNPDSSRDRGQTPATNGAVVISSDRPAPRPGWTPPAWATSRGRGWGPGRGRVGLGGRGGRRGGGSGSGGDDRRSELTLSDLPDMIDSPPNATGQLGSPINFAQPHQMAAPGHRQNFQDPAAPSPARPAAAPRYGDVPPPPPPTGLRHNGGWGSPLPPSIRLNIPAHEWPPGNPACDHQLHSDGPALLSVSPVDWEAQWTHSPVGSSPSPPRQEDRARSPALLPPHLEGFTHSPQHGPRSASTEFNSSPPEQPLGPVNYVYDANNSPPLPPLYPGSSPGHPPRPPRGRPATRGGASHSNTPSPSRWRPYQENDAHVFHAPTSSAPDIRETRGDDSGSPTLHTIRGGGAGLVNPGSSPPDVGSAHQVPPRPRPQAEDQIPDRAQQNERVVFRNPQWEDNGRPLSDDVNDAVSPRTLRKTRRSGTPAPASFFSSGVRDRPAVDISPPTQSAVVQNASVTAVPVSAPAEQDGPDYDIALGSSGSEWDATQ